MNRYETILSDEKNILNLMNKGIVPLHILGWKVYYEAYLFALETEKKNFSKVKISNIVAYVAESYKISDRTMYRVIDFMEERLSA